MEGILKIIYFKIYIIKKNKTKKYSLNNISNGINNIDLTKNIYYDNKTERINRKTLYDINGEYL